MDTIGSRIQQIRRARGLSREALHQATHISVEGIRRIEVGVVPSPRFDTVAAIMKALDTSLDVLTAETIEVRIHAHAPTL